MTFDYEIALINVTGYTKNSIGDRIPKEEKTDVLCDIKDVTRTEHYAAAAHGMKPEIVFMVNKYEYQGQKEVEYEGVRYTVMRAYSPKKSKGINDFETTELVCAGKVNSR